MSFFNLRCSTMWAAQPEVLEITKIGVKKSLKLEEKIRMDAALVVSTSRVEIQVRVDLLLLDHSLLNVSGNVN